MAATYEVGISTGEHDWVLAGKKRQRTNTGGDSRCRNVDRTDLDVFKNMSIDDKLVTLYTKVSSIENMGERLAMTEQTLGELQGEFISTSRRIKLLEYKSIDAEARNRRCNLIFKGISEMGDDEDCVGLIKDFISNNLELDSDDFFIQRAHRIGRKQTNRRGHRKSNRELNSQTQPRPIIVAFRDFPDTELILENTSRLRSTPALSVYRDYPKEIAEARKVLWPRFKAAKKEKLIASIKFPAKLMVGGQLVCDMFPDWFEVLRDSRIPTLSTPKEGSEYKTGYRHDRHDRQAFSRDTRWTDRRDANSNNWNEGSEYRTGYRQAFYRDARWNDRRDTNANSPTRSFSGRLRGWDIAERSDRDSDSSEEVAMNEMDAIAQPSVTVTGDTSMTMNAAAVADQNATSEHVGDWPRLPQKANEVPTATHPKDSATKEKTVTTSKTYSVPREPRKLQDTTADGLRAPGVLNTAGRDRRFRSSSLDRGCARRFNDDKRNDTHDIKPIGKASALQD